MHSAHGLQNSAKCTASGVTVLIASLTEKHGKTTAVLDKLKDLQTLHFDDSADTVKRNNTG